MRTLEPDRVDVLAGLDVLETDLVAPSHRIRQAWSAAWPKLAALALVVAAWQTVVWSGWRPEYLLPGPVTVFRELRSLVGEGTFWKAISITLKRAAVGYA